MKTTRIALTLFLPLVLCSQACGDETTIDEMYPSRPAAPQPQPLPRPLGGTIPIVTTVTYVATATFLSASPELLYSPTPKGGHGWQSRADFDFAAGKHVWYDVVYAVAIRNPKAIDNRLTALDFSGLAWTNMGAASPCPAAEGVPGDTVKDGNGNVACVAPWLAMSITDDAGTDLYDRPGPAPLPPLAWGQPLPKGTVVVTTGLERLILRLHIRGTQLVEVDSVLPQVAEKAVFWGCDAKAC